MEIKRADKMIARYDKLDWYQGSLEVWLGATLPQGAPTTSACGFVLSTEGKLVLVRVTSRGWDLPGGHLEGNETSLEAFSREVREEAGVTINKAQLIGWFALSEDDSAPTSQMAVYRATILEAGELTTTVPDEVAEVASFSIDQLPEGMSERIWFPFVAELRDYQ